MYDLMKGKLLILPEWVNDALEAHEMKPADIVSIDGLESILSPADVQFYLKQVNLLVDCCRGQVNPGPNMTHPMQALLDSLHVLHTNNVSVSGEASGLEEGVKINTLYGKEFAHYDFFNKLEMNSYLPRMLAASIEGSVNVDPYVEMAGNDLFVLRFTVGFYESSVVEDPHVVKLPYRARTFLNNTLRLLMANYGFEEIIKTKLFDLYSQLPN